MDEHVFVKSTRRSLTSSPICFSMPIYHSLLRSPGTISLQFLHNQYRYSPEKPSILSRKNNKHQWGIPRIASKRCHFQMRNSAFCEPKREDNGESTDGKISDFVGKSAGVFRSVFPGGCWWSLPEHDEAQFAAAEPVTVWFAVRQMWNLVGDDGWIIFVAFGALIFAAISEISMPGILTACIFSAQRGEAMAFYRNLQLLAILCIVSGMSSGLRSGCFAVANVILASVFLNFLRFFYHIE